MGRRGDWLYRFDRQRVARGSASAFCGLSTGPRKALVAGRALDPYPKLKQLLRNMGGQADRKETTMTPDAAPLRDQPGKTGGKRN
jgi:hypothetical protein